MDAYPHKGAANTGMSASARALILSVLVAALLGSVAPAGASTIVGRNASAVELQVSRSGEAFVSYRARGKQQRVLASGAINALAPVRGGKQAHFALDYTGGFIAHYLQNPAVKAQLAKLRLLQAQMTKATAAHNNTLRYALAPRISAIFRKLAVMRKAAMSFSNACRPYRGPSLPWLVVSCTAPDGSHWALQSWQRMLPNLGLTPWRSSQSVWELRLSHWSGPLPALEIQLDWVNTQNAEHLFGRLSYLDEPVHGFGSTSLGDPTDSFGRNIYLDTFDSAYGPGWERENSFLAHNPGGNFCYGFYAHAPYAGYPAGLRPAGNGARYRATVIGPGVLPDVGWKADSLGSFDPTDPIQVVHEQNMNALSDSFSATDALCRQH